MLGITVATERWERVDSTDRLDFVEFERWRALYSAGMIKPLVGFFAERRKAFLRAVLTDCLALLSAARSFMRLLRREEPASEALELATCTVAI